MLFNLPAKPIKRTTLGHEMYRTLCIHCKKSYPVHKTTGGNSGLRAHQSSRKPHLGCCEKHGCSLEEMEGVKMCKTPMEQLKAEAPSIAQAKHGEEEFMSSHL